MSRISYRFLVPGCSAKPLVSAHDRIMGTHSLAIGGRLLGGLLASCCWGLGGLGRAVQAGLIVAVAAEEAHDAFTVGYDMWQRQPTPRSMSAAWSLRYSTVSRKCSADIRCCLAWFATSSRSQSEPEPLTS